MGNSILNTTKKILGLGSEYTAFDLDIITFINTALSTLTQLGVGPSESIQITDAEDEWSELEVDKATLNIVKTYIFLRVRLLFDPPSTSYLIESSKKQLEEYEWRLNTFREIKQVEEIP